MPSSGFIIQQRGDAGPLWFSINEGRNAGNPRGGWTTDLAKALQFKRERDAADVMQAFIPPGTTTDVKVVPIPEAP